MNRKISLFCCLLSAVFLFGAVGCKEKEPGNTEVIGITKLKTFVDTPVENPAAEVVVGDITYQLNDEGNGYKAFVFRQDEYENVQKIARSVNGLPIVECAFFAKYKWKESTTEAGWIDPSACEKYTFDTAFIPDGVTGLSVSFDGTQLWIPSSVSRAEEDSSDALDFSMTNFPVYFSNEKRTYWNEQTPLPTEISYLDEDVGFYSSLPFGGERTPFSAKTYYVPPWGEPGMVFSGYSRHYGLGGIFQASCLRFYDENGNVQYEIPFANQQSEIVQVTEKENWYRTEVKESDLPAGDWYYISDSGEWKRFSFGQIDYTRQQIVALYPFAATEG